MFLALTIVHILAAVGLLAPLVLPPPYVGTITLATALGVAGHAASAMALNGKGDLYAYLIGLLYCGLLVLVGLGTLAYLVWGYFFDAMHVQLVWLAIYPLTAILGALSSRYIYLRGKMTELKNET